MCHTRELSPLVSILGEERVCILRGTMSALEETGVLQAFFLHGSYTRGNHAIDSDIDAVAVFAGLESAAVEHELPARMRRVAPVLIDAYTTRFPWFGRLWTFYFREPPGFALDLGIISREELGRFYVEPDAVIIRDCARMVAERKQRCYIEALAARQARYTSVEFDVYHTLVKLRRTLLRGHLWNAVELINVLRRTLFEFIRMGIDAPDYVVVGRPERDIETIAPASVLNGLGRTIPTLDLGSVIDASLVIVDRIRALLRTEGISNHDGLIDRAVADLRALAPLPADAV